MATVLVSGKLSQKEFEIAKEDYQNYVKITIDIESGLVVLGGEYHADAEKVLLDHGSRQENIWGGGIDLETKKFETNAIVNMRAGRNDSAEILDSVKREKFLVVAREILAGFV